MKCCERGDELSGCVKCCTFLDSLRSYSIWGRTLFGVVS
jgi:hypothetical protein